MALYKHQKETLDLLTNNNEFAVLDEMGTGKTMTMLYHISNLMLSGKIQTALVVCPKYVIGSWERDILKLPPFRRQAIEGKIDVINYDKVWRKTYPKYQEPYDLIVLDEAHAICNRTSKRTKWAIGYKAGNKVVYGANRKSRYRYILTGTPLDKGKLEQFWCLFEFLKPDYLKTYPEFSARYLIEKRLPNSFVTFIVGYRNQDELLEKVGEYSTRHLKKECLDLPEKLDPVIIFADNKEKALYKTAEKSYIEELMMNFANPLVKVAKLRQIASGFIIDDYGKVHKLQSEKIQLLQELMEDILPHKIVVFAHYTFSIEQIASVCNKLKVKYVILNGQTKDKKAWQKFQEDDSIKVFIGQYQSAREGIDLFASSHVVFYEPCLDTRTLYQASDRCHRIGQHNPVNYYHIITKGTIEEVIYKRLSLGEDLNTNYLRTVVEKGEFKHEDYICR